MDFFGFVSPNADFNSPIGALIRSATDPLLLGPDWAKNIEICDEINSSRDVPEPAIKSLLRRMQDVDPKVVSLSLVIAEACMKNCGQNFASFVTKAFMDEMVAITKGSKGSKNQEDALRLLQQWGKSYQSNRGPLSFFYDTYASLRAKGIQFPPDDDVVLSPCGGPSDPSAAGTRSDPSSQSVDDVRKLHNDLGEVFEKVRLCREMLVESPGIKEDEALSEVVGYLESCRDRMVDLVEAGTQGLLGEELLALCLRANDAVLRTLEAEKNGTGIEIEDGLPPPTVQKTASGPTKSDTPSMRTGIVDELDNDEFSNLALKTSTRRAGGGGPASASKPKPIAPPPQQSLLVPALPAPPGNSHSHMNLLPMDDLLTGPPPTPTPAPAPAKPLPSDIDMFLATADSFPADTTTSSSSVPFPPNPPTTGTANMSDADFDAFLNGMSSTK